MLLLLVGFKLESRNGWLICLSIMAALSVMAWLSALKRLRAVRDTPTSRIASAAQGYVELAGRGLQFGETPLLSKLSALPCLWYRYKIERRTSKNKWQTVDSGESDDSFMLRDDTGECIVDLEQAEIITRHRDQWHEGDHRYTEWKLLEHDRLYAIGAISHARRQHHGIQYARGTQRAAGRMEKDKPALHARFDLDNNGTLDMQGMDAGKISRQTRSRQENARGPGSAGHPHHLPAARRQIVSDQQSPDKMTCPAVTCSGHGRIW